MVTSTTLKVAGGCTAFLAWAVWYDHYRRNKSDYKSKLVQKRKNELLAKREKSDPYFYLKSIALCSDPQNPMAQQTYMMTEIQKGEELLQMNEIQKGAGHIAMGLAYLPQQHLMMTLQQLAMGLPREVLALVQEYIRVAKGRTQKQQMELVMGAASSQREKTPQPAGTPQLKDIEPTQEPEDVDSIDGDTEPKVIESDEEQVAQIVELPEDEEVRVTFEKKDEDEDVEEQNGTAQDETELDTQELVDEPIDESDEIEYEPQSRSQPHEQTGEPEIDATAENIEQLPADDEPIVTSSSSEEPVIIDQVDHEEEEEEVETQQELEQIIPEQNNIQQLSQDEKEEAEMLELTKTAAEIINDSEPEVPIFGLTETQDDESKAVGDTDDIVPKKIEHIVTNGVGNGHVQEDVEDLD